ncbi:MAG: MFS transporter [Gammaproteobacteria bacterium]|nr:MFS transporter [Gammaproteobacteria bacterium]
MSLKKNYIILVGILGTVFEWLEYSYYGYLTTKISQLFFPNYDTRTGILAAMGIFAAGFIMRPVGGVLFGYLGDRKGRKSALFLSLLLMGFSTLLMGALPTYQTIGIYAPLLLLFCRLLQGLAVSGEFNGAAIFLIEHNKNKYPTLAGSWVGTASALGMLLGILAATIVSYPGMPSWSWRVPFIFACVSCFIANYLRYKLLETPLFLEANNQQQISCFPLKKVLTQFKKPFLCNMILAAFVSVYIYVCNMYFVSYLIKDLHFAPSQSTLLASIGEFLVVLCLPCAAILADRFGYKKIFLIGLYTAPIATALLFITAKNGSIPNIVIAEIIFGISNAFACAPMFNFIYKLFPTHIRYTGNSTAWSCGVAIFGGTAPIVADFLMHQFSFYGPTLFVSLFALLTIFIVTRKETSAEILQSENIGVQLIG